MGGGINGAGTVDFSTSTSEKLRKYGSSGLALFVGTVFFVDAVNRLNDYNNFKTNEHIYVEYSELNSQKREAEKLIGTVYSAEEFIKNKEEIFAKYEQGQNNVHELENILADEKFDVIRSGDLKKTYLFDVLGSGFLVGVFSAVMIGVMYYNLRNKNRKYSGKVSFFEDN